MGLDKATKQSTTPAPVDKSEFNNSLENFKLKKLSESASKWVGTSEVKNNVSFSNPEFKDYIAKGGFTSGAPYCASFAKSCALESAETPDEVNLVKKVLTPHSMTSLANAKKAGIYSPTPTNNSIAIFQKGTSQSGHTAIVERVNDNGTINTIEGNTGASGGREGDGVYRKTRNINSNNKSGLHIVGYINFEQK